VQNENLPVSYYLNIAVLDTTELWQYNNNIGYVNGKNEVMQPTVDTFQAVVW
jgi:hypothetical protein